MGTHIQDDGAAEVRPPLPDEGMERSTGGRDTCTGVCDDVTRSHRLGRHKQCGDAQTDPELKGSAQGRSELCGRLS